MRGWIRVAAAGLEGSEALVEWVGRGLMVARARPPKHPSL